MTQNSQQRANAALNEPVMSCWRERSGPAAGQVAIHRTDKAPGRWQQALIDQKKKKGA
jgi:hypothetical protein